MKKAILGLVGVALLSAVGAMADNGKMEPKATPPRSKMYSMLTQDAVPNDIMAKEAVRRDDADTEYDVVNHRLVRKPVMSKDHATLKRVDQNGAFEIPFFIDMAIYGKYGAQFPIKDANLNLHPNKNEGPKYTLRNPGQLTELLTSTNNETLTKIKRIRDFFSSAKNQVFGKVVPKDFQVQVHLAAQGHFENNPKEVDGHWVLDTAADVHTVTLVSKGQTGNVISESIQLTGVMGDDLQTLAGGFRKKFEDDLALGRTAQERKDILSNKITVPWGDLSPEQRNAIKESQMNTKTDKTGQSKPTNKDLNKGFDELALEQKVAKRASRLQ
jgi:hypothetical protein